MKIQEYEIMNEMMKHTYINQRELAEITGYSVGKVNQAIKTLLKERYLKNTKELTEKAQQELEKKKPRNAVILAAGYGMRMVPINVEVPKGLLEIKGEPLIERLICQLQMCIRDRR